jgi:hypothetical protein
MPRSGVRSALLAALVVIGGSVSCWFPYGFAGGGLPPNIKTVAVLPFDNETAMPDLQRDVTETLRRELAGKLGLREAAENRANAVVRGKILRYDPDIPIGYSADPNRASTARRKLQITVDVSIIDQSSGKPLLEKRGLVSEGEYAESAETAGRRQAIEKLVDEIVRGVQSQW